MSFDKFKDALTAPQACKTAAAALREVRPDAEIDLCPIADGGDGFAVILTRAARGEMHTVTVRGPHGQPIAAAFGVVDAGDVPPAARRRLNVSNAARLAVVEMAAASGLSLLPNAQRNVWQADSFGTGELLAAAARRGVDAIVLGIGGSATNDLGLGALTALGLHLQDAEGQVVGAAPAAWRNVARLAGELQSLPPIYVACDVTNPLLGPNGAAAVYGPQKGLPAQEVADLDAASSRLAALLCARTHRTTSVVERPGMGAAGGMSFGLVVAYGAVLLPGFDFVAEWLNLDERIASVDVVVTGEGRFDDGSLRGKGPATTALRAFAAGKEVHVFAGAVSATAPAGVHVHAITPPDTSLADALRESERNLATTVARVFARR